MNPNKLYNITKQYCTKKEQALIKLRDDEIKVTIYGHKYREVLEPLYYHLNSKLKEKGIDPKVPWLNNHTLKFKFK